LARPNAIITGSVVLFLVAVGVGLVFLLRRPALESSSDERTVRPIAARQQPAPRLARTAQPPPQAPRLSAEGEPAAQADAGLPRTEVEKLLQRRWRLADNFELSRQQAAETLFVRLGISEDKRAAIRVLNQRTALKVQTALTALRNNPGQPLAGGATGENAGVERREALQRILGEATAAAYQKLERAEIRRLQVRFIAPWDAEMDKLTFPPPAPP
jgi:hypothetical protein